MMIFLVFKIINIVIRIYLFIIIMNNIIVTVVIIIITIFKRPTSLPVY